MGIKKEYLILGVVIVALSIYLLVRESDRSHYDLPVLPEIPTGEISKIEITQLDETILLEKRDQQWFILPESYKAEKNQIETMLDHIEKIRLTALVSTAGNVGLYDLDGNHKIGVKAWQGDKLAREFDIGKAATSFRHTFVRIADDERVYHARGNFRTDFDQTVDDLRDKTVLAFDQNDIQEIRLTADKKSVNLLRNTSSPGQDTNSEDAEAGEEPPATAEDIKTVWETSQGAKAKEMEINRLLNTLSNLRCDKYLEGRTKKDFDQPLYTVELKGLEEYKLSVFSKEEEDDKNYPAVSSANEYPFLLAEWQVNNIKKTPEEFLEKTENLSTTEDKKEK